MRCDDVLGTTHYENSGVKHLTETNRLVTDTVSDLVGFFDIWERLRRVPPPPVSQPTLSAKPMLCKLPTSTEYGSKFFALAVPLDALLSCF